MLLFCQIGTKFARLPCEHFFCSKCLHTFAQMHVKEGTVGNLQCPNSKCALMIPPSLLSHLLNDIEYERWESLMLDKTLASMSDVFYCPRCETPCIEDEEKHAQCSKCFFSFCTLCRERRHVGMECTTLDMKLQYLQEQENSSLLKNAQKMTIRDIINEHLSLKQIRSDSKQCPSCKMAIYRTGGCNIMVCRNCGQHFCYSCNEAIDVVGHFREGSCKLYPQGMAAAWHERIQIQRGQCPTCRQFNEKVGNHNYMFCRACQRHYCYSCKQLVKSSSQHYGRKGCKRHSDD